MNPSQLIDKQIQELGDWRGDLYRELRQLIHDADTEMAEEWKWSTGVFTHAGMVCSVGVFADHVKLNFFRGAELADPAGLFNAGLDAKKTRAIDFAVGSSVNREPLKALVAQAVARNLS
jgi:hypothetical protein